MITKTFLLRTFFLISGYFLANQNAIAQVFIDPGPEHYEQKRAQTQLSGFKNDNPAPTSINANNGFVSKAFDVSGKKAETTTSLTNCYFAPDNTYLSFFGNDDASIGPFALPFGFNLFGTIYNQFWINNNGNITFTGPFGSYSSTGFPFNVPMVAPFWADVETSTGNTVKYKINPTNVIVTWPAVGYYFQNLTKLNTFQVIISNGNDPLIGIGNNVAFYYGDMQWTTGDASSGVGGFGGIPATVGINKGDNVTYIQIGRFNLNNSSYDGPLGASDGVNYLDNQCYFFNVGNFGNLPPTVSGNPPNNTIDIPCGQTRIISLQALPPEVGQSVTATVNTGGLCNTAVSTTSGATANATVSIMGGACNQGTNVISFTFTDNFNPPATTVVNITVNVTSCCQPTTITCPQNITVSNATGQCGANVSFAATATGTSPTITYSHQPGSFFPVGTTTVTATASNSCSSNSCQFTVTVTDDEAPVISCPADITVSATSGQCGARVCYPTPVASDNCPPEIPAGYTFLTQFGNSYYYQSNNLADYFTHEANARAAGGHLAVVTSAAENNAIASSGVSFSFFGGNDTETEGSFKWVTCETNVFTRFCGSEPNGGTGENYLEFLSGGCWNDLPAGAPRYSILEIEGASIVQTAGLPQNAVFPVGTTINTFVVRDAAGNTNTCSFTITVTDDEDPVINCPADISVNNEPGDCSARVTFAATATDNCSAVVSYSHAPGTAFPVGTTIVTATATDPSGNSVSCSFRITVTDNEAPSISCPADVAMNTDPGICGATVNPGEPIARDNCEVATVTGVRSDNRPLNAIFPVGTTTIEWTATDIHGNSSTCTQTVVVTDNEAPAINCPGNITVSNDPGQCGAVVGYTATATDNCSATVTYSHAPGSYFPVGTTTVTATATDPSGNQSSCNFTVTVNDTEAPVIILGPVLSCYADNDFGCNINLGVNATDNCTLVSLTSNAPVCFPVGTTTVTWTALDNHGNVTIRTQEVTRNPEMNIDICAGPTRTIYTGTVGNAGPFGPQSVNLTATVSGGTPGYSYSWSPAAGLNNPFIANPVASPAATTTYTLTVTDSRGCTRSLSITVEVKPLSAAVCSGSGNNVKFNVCHVPPGNPGNAHNICISANALSAHLAGGSNGHNNCYLGPCSQLCFSTVPGATSLVETKGAPVEVVETIETTDIVEYPTEAFKVNAYPNPSAAEFSLQVMSRSTAPIRVRIMDMNGVVKSVSNVILKTNMIKVGANLPAGTYMAEIMQGENRQVIKLVKVN